MKAKSYTQYGIFVGDVLKGTWQADAWTREKLEEKILWRYGPEAYIMTRTVAYTGWFKE